MGLMNRARHCKSFQQVSMQERENEWLCPGNRQSSRDTQRCTGVQQKAGTEANTQEVNAKKWKDYLAFDSNK